MVAFLTAIICFGSVLAETAKPTIVMGTRTVLHDGAGGTFIICPAPYDNPCKTCVAHKDVNNTAIFYVSGSESGYGFTGVQVVVLEDYENSRTVKVIPVPGYVLWTDYAAWKTAVGE